MAKPKLRFPEFMDEWEEKTVGTIFEFTNGKAHEQCVDENGKYVIINSKFISTEGKIKKYTNDLICPLKKNDIVMVMSDVPNGRAMSKCFLIQEDDKYTLNQRICGLRTSQNSVFYIHQISRNKYYLKFDNGVSQTNLRKEDVLNCPVFETKDDEQQKIADFLSSVDDLIQTQEDKIAVLEEQKKGIIQKLFNREVRFKADDGSEFPEWEERKWGSIGQFFKSGNLSKSDLSEEGTPCILYGELYTKYNEIADTIYSKTNVPCEVVSEKGDVIIPKSGETPEDISTASCIPYDGVALGGDLIIFRSNCILGTYLSYLISNKKKWEIAKIAQGKSIVHINEKSLAKIDIEFPCIAEQQKIVDCLSAYNEVIQVKKDKLEVWKEIKKGLLQQMFV